MLDLERQVHLGPEPRQAGRMVRALIPGVKLWVPRLAPCTLLWPPRAGHPKAVRRVYGGAGSRPEPWLQSESPGITKSSLWLPNAILGCPL